MKKIYLLISSITLGSLAFGQASKLSTDGLKSTNLSRQTLSTEKNIVTPAKAKEKAAGTVLYSTDFSSKLNAVAPYGAWTTSGTNGNVWKYSSLGPNGMYSDRTDIITSTTASNGFVIFDADSAQGSATPVDITGKLHSPIIDLSLAPGAFLSFEQTYRHCCSNDFEPAIEVTTDNFVTVKRYNATALNVSVNDIAATGVFNVNLSSFLATATNKSNFQFRFSWDANSDYYWIIDDVKLIETAANDLELTSVILNKFAGTGDTYYPGNREATSIPKEFASTLTVQGRIKNLGHNPVSANTTLKVTVKDALNAEVTSETGGTLFQTAGYEYDGDTITFESAIDLSVLAFGTYTIVSELVNPGDANTANNAVTRTIKITDGLLGQENYDNPLSRTYSGGYNTPPAAHDYQTVGNIITTPSDPNVTTYDLQGFEVTLRQSSSYPITAGTEVEVHVYKVDPSLGSNAGRYTDIGETRIFKINAADIPAVSTTSSGVGSNNKPLMLNLNRAGGPIQLEPSTIYMVGIFHNGGSVLNVNQKFAFATQMGDDDYSSSLYTKAGTSPFADTWYWLGRQFLGRLSFDKSLALEENDSEISNSNLFPNPTTGKSTVSYSLGNASKVTVKVIDVTGKVVYTSTEESKEAGNHTSTIDATAFNTGVYYVTVSTNDSQLTQKLIKK